MADGGLDRELARRFEELRRADDPRTPSFRGVLERARRPDGSIRRRRPALLLAGAAAAVLLLAALLLRPGRGPAGSSGAVSGGAIAEWKSPTDSLLETPGNELYGELPPAAPPIPDWALDLERRSPGAAAPSTPARKGASS
ncbi:MAG TPA: hypothetical protein VIZ58_09705 [Thermoanaerobaculia bacterium]